MEKITPSDWGGMAWSIGFTLHENLYEITHHFAIERSLNHVDLDTCLETKEFQHRVPLGKTQLSSVNSLDTVKKATIYWLQASQKLGIQNSLKCRSH